MNRSEAYQLLILSINNPDSCRYVSHCRYVGDLAGRIAAGIGLDGEFAATLGILHDVGRRIEPRRHAYAGYLYLKDLGLTDHASVCLTHSFLANDIECTAGRTYPKQGEEYPFLSAYVASHVNSPYEEIIQLCDLLCLHCGCTSMEERLSDIEARKGKHAKSELHYRTAKALQFKYETMLGHPISDFYVEINRNRYYHETEETTMFDTEKVKNACVAWIRNFFEENGKGCNAVVGISGGKDSSVVAALCCEALGRDRVIGVLMPCGEQHDIDCAKQLVEHLGIRHYVVNIKDAVDGMLAALPADMELTAQARQNLPPRIRMATLYAVSQSNNGRVANTCNLSEDWVGYSTRYGDAAGDFSPCSRLTVQEVKKIGHALGLPDNLVEKTPIDGLCGKTDEENLGFTYAELDRYIREGVIDDPQKKENIDRRHRLNLFKLSIFPCFEPQL